MGLLDAFADPQFRKDVVRGLLDAGNRGAVAGLLGGPVDLATMALRPLGYNVEQPVGGSEWIGQKMQNLGLVSEKRNPLAEGLAAFAGPMAAQQIAPKVFAAELRAMENMAKPSPMNAATRGQAGAIVWHGSPHKFDKFDSSKIGTGEGAQAYGHGLYLAENPNIARGYQEKLSDAVYKVDGAVMPGNSDAVIVATEIQSRGAQGAKSYLLAEAEKAARLASESGSKKVAASADNFRRWAGMIDDVAARQFAVENGGSLYKVDLPDDQIARMLDWDKPLSQQAPEINAYAKSVIDKVNSLPGPKIEFRPNMTGEQIARLGGLLEKDWRAAALTQVPRQTFGIPGIRYLDGGSRGAGAGTSNYVVFPGNEDLLRILERNGVPLP